MCTERSDKVTEWRPCIWWGSSSLIFYTRKRRHEPVWRVYTDTVQLRKSSKRRRAKPDNDPAAFQGGWSQSVVFVLSPQNVLPSTLHVMKGFTKHTQWEDNSGANIGGQGSNRECKSWTGGQHLASSAVQCRLLTLLRTSTMLTIEMLLIIIT